MKPLGVAAGGALALPIRNCSASCEEVPKEFLYSCFLLGTDFDFVIIELEGGPIYVHRAEVRNTGFQPFVDVF